MFAFSHGTSAPEVMPGLEDPPGKVLAAMLGGAYCTFVAPGLIDSLAPVLCRSRDFGVVVKVTATASRGGVPHQERLICSVERAAELGADGVVALLPFAPDNEPDVISLTAELGEACAVRGCRSWPRPSTPMPTTARPTTRRSGGCPTSSAARACAWSAGPTS